MIIGLTGGSGTGKSTITDVFMENGYVVIDPDKIYAQVIAPDSACIREIAEVFGDEYILPDGCLNRSKMRTLVFSDKEKLEILNKITHKYVIERMNEEISDAGEKDVVIDAPLLFSAGLYKMCDKIVCVVSSEKKRIGRITARDGIDENSALARIKSQMTNEEYIEKSDYVIENNDGLDELLEKTLSVIESLKGLK